MKQFFWCIIIATFLLSCQDDITVQIEKEPGSIAGQILPSNIGATAELYQGSMIKQTQADAEGYFKFRDINAGTYRVRVGASNYGTREFDQVRVEEGEGYDLGVIELSRYPYPLSYAYPFNGQIEVSVTSSRIIMMEFETPMILATIQNAFTIDPQVTNLEFEESSPNPRYTYYVYISGDFKLGTEYHFTLDSTAQTIGGEPLEFSYTASFTTEYFKLTNFELRYVMDSDAPIYLTFNNDVNLIDLLNKMTLEPSVELRAQAYVRLSQVIVPVLSWIPDTTFNLTIHKELQDINGNYLQADTTFSFKTEPLKVAYTSPYDKQHFVHVYSYIIIDMNNLLDEGTIQNAVTINPLLDYEIDTNSGLGYTAFRLLPDSLVANTEYTVTIDTSLKDYYGGNLKEPYTFSFVTKE